MRLTGDVQVERLPVEAQHVARCSRNVVDANFVVDVLDAVIDGADVHVGYGRPVSKVHCDTGRGAQTLHKENNTLSLTLSVSWLMHIRGHFP